MVFVRLPFSNATHRQNALDQYMYRILILIFFVISFPLLPLTHPHQNRDLHSSSPLLRTLSSGLTVERETRDGVVDCHRRRLRRGLPDTPRRPAASTPRPPRRYRPARRGRVDAPRCAAACRGRVDALGRDLLQANRRGRPIHAAASPPRSDAPTLSPTPACYG